MPLPPHRHRYALRLLALAGLFAMVTAGSFFLALEVSEDTVAQQMVAQYGYLAILIMAIIAGLNAVVPIPAATFVPIFTEAGLWLPLIVLTLAVGTTIADFIGFAFGNVSKHFVERSYPRFLKWIQSLYERHRYVVVPGVILYAAFIPFPNEVLVIPLALLGVRFRTLLIPLLLGNTVNQAVLAYGFDSIFDLLV